MRRREFTRHLLMGGTAAIAAAPRVSRAQSPERGYRVGVLFPAGDSPGSRELIQAMSKLGYVAGRNIAYDILAAGGEPERLPELARALVARKPDVIVSATDLAGRALTDATRDIPIVLALVGDPVVLGHTHSMARPTGNLTGFTTGHDTIAVKRVELLRELVPAARKVALLWGLANAQHRIVVERTYEAGAALNIDVLSLPVEHAEDIAPAIARAESEGASGLLVAADPMIVRNRHTIIDQSLMRDLPAIHSYSMEVRDGALMSYGSEVGEDYARTADYVDRILRGAKVANLPFQEPTQFHLAINLRTARAMQLEVPPPLLFRADQVIE